MIKSFNKLIGYLLIIVIVLIILFSKQKLNVIPIGYSEIILSTLFIIYFFTELYIDITNRQYSTSIFIIIVDFISIISLIALCYLYFKNYDKTNMDIVWNRKISVQMLASLVILMIPIKFILEDQRFRK